MLVLSGLTWLASPAYCADYMVYVVDPPINNYPVLPDGPLPDTCRVAKTTFSVTACRGEYEPISFVIETPQPLGNVDVKIGPLRGDGGEITSAAVDVRVVAPVFRQITGFPASVHWMLVHDPNLIITKDEPQAIALKEDAPEHVKAYLKTTFFTRRAVDTAVLQAADVESRQQFWLTVHVPDGAAGGTYSGDITILADNTEPRKFTLELTVPDFDLEPPRAEYSIYHPVWLEGVPGIEVDNEQGYVVLSEQRYLVDLQNLAAHGCMNPNIYTGPQLNDQGDLDFTLLATVLDLREQAGMKRRGPLYVLGSQGIISTGKVTPQEKEQNIRLTRQLVAWVRGRGYSDVYLGGYDEATGDTLMAQRDAWQAIHEGGGKIFVAHYAGYTEGIGDLLDLPIMLHPIAGPIDDVINADIVTGLIRMPAREFLRFPEQVRKAVNAAQVFEPSFEGKIRRIHEHGFRAATYMDPLAGYTVPEVHRRMRGLVMWKARIDCTMTWSYTHITLPRFEQAGPFDFSIFSFVLRGPEAPFDSLSWEGYREAYDDARYMATLHCALDNARQHAGDDPQIEQTTRWLSELDVVDGDLDAIRRDMVRRITALRALSRKWKRNR